MWPRWPKSFAVTGTGGGKQTFDYNPATPTCNGFEGQICKVTTATSATKSVSASFLYDTKGNLSKVTPPAPLGSTTYTYDALGRPETVTDGRGIKTPQRSSTRGDLQRPSGNRKDQTTMRHAFLAAPGGGPDLPVWGQVLFVVVAVLIGVLVVKGLLSRRHK